MISRRCHSALYGCLVHDFLPEVSHGSLARVQVPARHSRCGASRALRASGSPPSHSILLDLNSSQMVQGIHHQCPICHHPWVCHNDDIVPAYKHDSARDMACPIRRDARDQLPPFDGFDVSFDENRDGIYAMLLSPYALPRTDHPMPSAKYARSHTGWVLGFNAGNRCGIACSRCSLMAWTISSRA